MRKRLKLTALILGLVTVNLWAIGPAPVSSQLPPLPGTCEYCLVKGKTTPCCLIDYCALAGCCDDVADCTGGGTT